MNSDAVDGYQPPDALLIADAAALIADAAADVGGRHVVHFTWVRTLKFYWSLFWRAFLFMSGIAMVVTPVLAVFDAAQWGQLLTNVAAIPVFIAVVRSVVNKRIRYSDFEVVAISLEDP